jgi:hypothetical protein
MMLSTKNPKEKLVAIKSVIDINLLETLAKKYWQLILNSVSPTKKQLMKIFYFFLIFSLFSCEVLAVEDVKPGILKQLIEENAEEISEQEKSSLKPKLTNRLVLDVNLDDEYQSTDRKREYNDTYGRMRLFSGYNFAKNFSLNSFIRIDPVYQSSEATRRNNLANGGGDISFENEGLFLEELNLTYNGKKHAFVLGKFDLNFGTAWRWNRGIWTYNIAENYRQNEKLGVNGIYRLGNAKTTGLYEFSYGIFKNDRKNLDNSLITDRDSNSKSDAIAGDSGGLQSYITSLDINFDFSQQEKLSYHFSYINLGVNSRASLVNPNKIADQKGFVAGMNYKYPVQKNYIIDGLLEYAAIKNLNGNSDVGEKYFTANVINRFYENWNVTLGYANRDNSHVGQYGFTSNLTEISMGYEFLKNSFFDKLLFQIGYKNQRNNFGTSLETRNVLGALMRYQKNF